MARGDVRVPIGPGELGMGRAKIRIEFQRLLEIFHRLRKLLWRIGTIVDIHALQVGLIGCRIARASREFCLPAADETELRARLRC